MRNAKVYQLLREIDAGKLTARDAIARLDAEHVTQQELRAATLARGGKQPRCYDQDATWGHKALPDMRQRALPARTRSALPVNVRVTRCTVGLE